MRFLAKGQETRFPADADRYVKMETSISEEKHDRNIYIVVTIYLQKILMAKLFRCPIIEGSLCQEHSSFFRHRAMVHIEVPSCISAPQSLVSTPIANHRCAINPIEASANCLILLS